MKDKSYFRNLILNKRKIIENNDLSVMSKDITDKLISTEYYKKSKIVFCYVDFKNEVMTKDILKKCIEDKKILTVPKIVTHQESKEMLSIRVDDIERSMEIGHFGIKEPRFDENKLIDPKAIDLIIVPGIAFDKRGNRIGFGAGYYDKFLNNIKAGCIKIGICFEFQLFNEIPSEVHDVSMDIIMTEKRIDIIDYDKMSHSRIN